MEPETTPKTAAARLTDIEVDEVSMVDKAANKRKYLVVKNAGGEPVSAPAGDPPAPAPGSVPAGDPPAPAPAPVGDPGNTTPAPGPAPSAPETAPAPAAAPETAAPAADTPVEKRGAKMAKARLARFKAAHQQLGELITELETATAEMADAVDALEEGDATEAAKAAARGESAVVAKVAGLEGRVADLEGQLRTANEKIGKQAEVINKARFDGVGNGNEPDGLGAPPPAKVIWPRDLNEERKPRRTAAPR
jgi:chaperonin cofactor prefoldin